MKEPRIIKHRNAYVYVGDKPEGAPDFETIECVAKSAYDALKAKNERLKEELKLTRNVSDQALKNKVSVLQNQIDQLYKTLIRNAEIQAVPRLVMIPVRQEIDALKAKCDAYEQALEGLIKHVSEWTSADMIDDAAVQAREVLAKYKGE